MPPTTQSERLATIESTIGNVDSKLDGLIVMVSNINGQVRSNQILLASHDTKIIGVCKDVEDLEKKSNILDAVTGFFAFMAGVIAMALGLRQ